MKNEVIIEAKLETKDFDREIDLLTEKLEGLEEEYDNVKKAKPFEGQQEYLEKLSKQIIKTKKDLSKLITEKEKFEKSKLPGIQNEINGIGNSISNVVKKVGKWALAVFGVRSAYMFVRNAINTLSQDNEQLATDIDFMKRALAYTIEPVVQTIVNLAKTLMQYIAYIVKMWTGRDIFANANKSLKGANKSAKELKKTTAGFDELNILSSNTSANGGGVATPSIQGLEGNVPKWLEWIGQNKDKVLGFFTELAVGIIAVKLASANFMALGIGVIVAGIAYTIKSIIDFIKDPSWENFSKVLTGLAIALTGVSIAMLAVNAANPLAWITLAIAGILLLTATIIKNWDNIKLKFKNVGKWINDSIIKPIKDKFNSLPNWLKILIKGMVNTAITMLNGLISGLNLMLTPLRAAITIIGKVMGKNWTLQTISIPKIPRLAKGGIVNLPGKGVNYAGANIGERGAEGIIPLTDTAQMSMLGEAIGRYITVNLTNITELDGRTIARKVSEVNNNTNFLLNR